jgi:hypothetical protein
MSRVMTIGPPKFGDRCEAGLAIAAVAGIRNLGAVDGSEFAEDGL